MAASLLLFFFLPFIANVTTKFLTRYCLRQLDFPSPVLQNMYGWVGYVLLQAWRHKVLIEQRFFSERMCKTRKRLGSTCVHLLLGLLPCSLRHLHQEPCALTLIFLSPFWSLCPPPGYYQMRPLDPFRSLVVQFCILAFSECELVSLRKLCRPI